MMCFAVLLLGRRNLTRPRLVVPLAFVRGEGVSEMDMETALELPLISDTLQMNLQIVRMQQNNLEANGDAGGRKPQQYQLRGKAGQRGQ